MRHAVYDQAGRWLKAGCFEMLAHDLRATLRLASGRAEELKAVGAPARAVRVATGDSVTPACVDQDCNG